MVLHCTAYCLTCQVSFKLGSDLSFNVFIFDCTLLAYKTLAYFPVWVRLLSLDVLHDILTVLTWQAIC